MNDRPIEVVDGINYLGFTLENTGAKGNQNPVAVV
jgi:hypothetical protein